MSKEELKPTLSKRVKRSLSSVLVASLFSGLAASGIIYTLTKSDNQKNWCRQEIKSFDYNNYAKKELSMLIQECEDEIKTYGLLEDTLYNSNDTKKFASIINQLYVDKKIDNNFIIEFSNAPLMEKINNPNYNFDDRNLYKKNNLPELKGQIGKYLSFTKEILFTSYKEEQQRFYYSLLVSLFRDNDYLIKNNKAPEFSMHGIKDNSIEPEINKNLSDLQVIFKNLGKIEKRKFRVDSTNPFQISLSVVVNSYRHKDNKYDLINEVVKLSEIVDKNMNRDRRGEVTNKQWINNIETAGTSAHIMKLILLELTHYKLEGKELKTIFEQYARIMQYLTSRNTFHKLIHTLFTDEIISRRTNFRTLYTELFLKSFQKEYIFSTNIDFITYLALKKDINILQTLLKTFEENKYFKRYIFSSFIVAETIGKKHYYMSINYENMLIAMIEKEKDEDIKREFIRKSLVLNNIKLIDYAINYINANQDFYIKELNNNEYHGVYFDLSSVFSYLAGSQTPIISKQKEIKKKKTDLYIKLIKNVTNKSNKLHLIDATTQFITKDDFDLIKNVKEIISKEIDTTLKEQMQKKFSKIYIRD